MAKIGIEVEGRLRGVPTLFLSAGVDNLVLAADMLIRDTGKPCHVYISDELNTLDYEDVGRLFDQCLVTMDVTQVIGVRPRNVTIMFRIDKCPQEHIFDSTSRLDMNDQIKIERDQNVYVLPFNSAILTFPHEFAGDKEITL